MTLLAEIEIPVQTGTAKIDLESGKSIVFIGANGAGKTRLGVHIDRALSSRRIEVHRIAAHRSLILNPTVVPPSLEIASKRLRFGYDQGEFAHKEGHRWRNQAEVGLLNDFDHLLAALYAENNHVSVSYTQRQLAEQSNERPPEAKILKLKRIWQAILPHRELIVEAGNIKVRTAGESPQVYAASELSDGERVIFYLLGQTLLAEQSTILIFDEPELHVNKSVLNKLWDEIEASRPDCMFIYITHDVDFASSRHAAEKYAVRSYSRSPNEAWDLELIPNNLGIPDDVVATIVGSRRPILFIEGDIGSLDSSLYRRVYSEYTVIPVGSCEQVIANVASFSARKELHRFGCAGLIDADGRSSDEVSYLEELGIYCLPVSEVENLLLLPTVFLEVAKSLNFTDADAQRKLEEVKLVILSQLSAELEPVCLRFTKRRLDANIKRLSVSGKDIRTLCAEFAASAAALDITSIYDDAKADVLSVISREDYERALYWYDNKGLLAKAAAVLDMQKRQFEEYVARTLRSDRGHGISAALVASLPKVRTKP